MRSASYFPFHLLLTGICILLLLPVWVQYGMFMDGVQYACVSKNLAAGKGTFWFPYLCESWWYGTNSFMEHPPLFYAVQSVFFKVFGDGMYTERIFCAAMLVLNAWLIHCTWKLIAVRYGFEKKMSWFPILLWISIPVCFWSFQNNIIEILVSVFTLLSIYCMLYVLFRQRYILPLLLLSGICIFLATLTKGIPGFFPVTTILLFCIFTKEISLKRALLYSFVITAVPLIIYALLLTFNKTAKESLTFYFIERLLHRVQQVPSTDTRFFILIGLFSELIPVFVIGALLLFVKVKEKAPKPQLRFFLFLLAVGLSGTLPLMLTMVQNKFYFVPALPFYALGFAVLLYPRIRRLSEWVLSTRAARISLFTVGALIFAGGVVYSTTVAGKDRDVATMAEVRAIGPVVKGSLVIGVEQSIYEDWSFQFYLYRYYDVSIEPYKHPLPYLITRTMPADSMYEAIPLPTKKYRLYRLRS